MSRSDGTFWQQRPATWTTTRLRPEGARADPRAVPPKRALNLKSQSGRDRSAVGLVDLVSCEPFPVNSDACARHLMDEFHLPGAGLIEGHVNDALKVTG